MTDRPPSVSEALIRFALAIELARSGEVGSESVEQAAVGVERATKRLIRRTALDGELP